MTFDAVRTSQSRAAWRVSSPARDRHELCDVSLASGIRCQALFPVVPFFLAEGTTGMAWSLAPSVAALGAIGLATSLFNGRGPVYSAARQVGIGAVAAGVTYAVGALIGVSLS